MKRFTVFDAEPAAVIAGAVFNPFEEIGAGENGLRLVVIAGLVKLRSEQPDSFHFVCKMLGNIDYEAVIEFPG